METKVYKIRGKILMNIVLSMVFGTIFFTSCLQDKGKNEFVLWATVYKLEIPAFSPPFGEDEVIERVNIVYLVQSNRPLDEHGFFAERTGNSIEPLKTICIDTVNQSKYRYECYSNKYIDVKYKPENLKEYYQKASNIIKNSKLIYKDCDTDIAFKKIEGYKEYFETEMCPKVPNGTRRYNVDDL